MDQNFIVVGNIGLDLERFEKSAVDFLNYNPQLMIVTGNVTKDGSDESYLKSYKALEKFYKRFGIPVEVTPGETDLRNGVLPDTYKGYFRDPKASFTWGGVKFISLDSSAGEIDDKQLDFLDKQLISPSFIFTHYPPDVGLWSFGGMKKGSDKFVSILAERTKLVLGCFFGGIKTVHKEFIPSGQSVHRMQGWVVGNTGDAAFEISKFGYSRPGQYGGLAVLMKDGRPTFEPIVAGATV